MRYYGWKHEDKIWTLTETNDIPRFVNGEPHHKENWPAIQIEANSREEAYAKWTRYHNQRQFRKLKNRP